MYEGGSLGKQICGKMARHSPAVYEDCFSKVIVELHIVSMGKGSLTTSTVILALALCKMLSTLSVSTKIAPIVSWGTSLCLCFLQQYNYMKTAPVSFTLLTSIRKCKMWGDSLCLFSEAAQLHEGYCNFIHTPHQYLQVLMPHMYTIPCSCTECCTPI